MATGKLIGADDGTIDGIGGASYTIYAQFTASVTGSCSEIRIKVSGNGNVKAAIFDATGAGGGAGNRLAKRDASTPVTTGWNILALESPCSLNAGTTYWLAAVSDSAILGEDSTTWNYLYKAVTYSTFTWPATGEWDSGGNNCMFFYAGWGTTGGWTYIAKVNGVASASIARINGVAVAGIAKINGVAV